jgi:hypothetical protein
MEISIRYTKDLGNSSIYVRVRSIDGKYYDFTSHVLSTSELSTCKSYLTEYQDSSITDSLYSTDVAIPNDVIYIIEIVDSYDNSVIGYGTTEIPLYKDQIETRIEQIYSDFHPITQTSVLIDHNYQTADALRYVDENGDGIENAIVLAYKKDDYVAGNIGPTFIQGSTYTDTFGRWKNKIILNSGLNYIIQIYKPGVTNVSTIEIDL